MENGDICGRGSWLKIVDTRVIVGVPVHSGVGIEEDIEVEVEVEVGVIGGVEVLVGRVEISRIGARVKIEVVMQTLVSHYCHQKNNNNKSDVM